MTVYLVIQKHSIDSMGGYEESNVIEKAFSTREKAEEYIFSGRAVYHSYNYYIKAITITE